MHPEHDFELDASARRLRLDVKTDGFVQNPYPLYAELHAQCRRVFWEDYGFWCFAGYDDVDRLLRDKRFGREVPGHVRAAANRDHLTHFDAIERHSLLELEPPEHTRLRRLVNRAFVSRQVETLRPKIGLRAHALIDQFENRNEVDLLKAFATPLPLFIIREMIGLAQEHEQHMLAWSHAMVKLYTLTATRDDELAADSACATFDAVIRQSIDDKRRSPDDSLLSLMATPSSGMSEAEIISTAVLLMNAGHEATVHQYGNTFACLHAREMSLTDAFGAGRDVAAGVEEVLRIEAPLHLFTRYAKEDVDLGDGIVIEEDQQIGLLLGAANRDPNAFDAPHRFNPSRPDQKNVTFGAGIHFCIGAPLARLELEIGLSVLAERLPNMTINAQPRFANTFHFHGLETLIVEPQGGSRRN